MNSLAKIEDITKDSGLELEQIQDLKTAYLPYLQKISETIETAKGINRENPTEEDEAKARELRLALVPNRTAAQKFKMARTEKLRLYKNVEDASYRLIENESKLVELELKGVEDFVANAKAVAIKELRESREIQVREYIDNPELYPLGEMNQEQFDKFLEDQKLAKGAREKIKKENEEKERQKQIEIDLRETRKDELIPFIEDLNVLTRLTVGMSPVDYKILKTELQDQKKERDQKTKKLQEDKNIFAKKLKEREKEDKKVESEVLDFIKILKKLLVSDGWVAKTPDLYAKRGHEISSEMLSEHSQATLEAFMKLTNKEIQEEAKIKAAADIKNSSDQTQLLSWVDTMHLPDVSLTTAEGKAVLKDIEKKFNGFKKWAESEILKLKL